MLRVAPGATSSTVSPTNSAWICASLPRSLRKRQRCSTTPQGPRSRNRGAGRGLTLLVGKRHAVGHQRERDVNGPAGVKTTKPNREEHAVTSTPLSRRDVLKGTVALA